MFFRVCTLLLEFIGKSEKTCLLQRKKDNGAEECCPCCDHDASDKLSGDLSTAVFSTIEDAVSSKPILRVSEESQSQQSPKSSGSMHCESINHIINLELLHQH